MDSRTDTKPQGSNGLFSVDNLTDNSAPTEVAEQPKPKRPAPQPVNNIFSEGNLKKKADGSGSSMPSTQPTSTSVPPSTLPTENDPANPLLSGQRPQQYGLDKSGFKPVINTISAPIEQSNQDATAKVGLTPIQQLQQENTSKPDATLNIPNIGVFNRQVNAFGEVTDKTITDNAPDESVVLRNEYNQKRKGILNPTVVVPQSQLTPENNFGLTAPNMQSSTDATAVSTPIKQVQGAPQNEPAPSTPEQQFRQKVNNNLTQLDKETIAKTGEYAMKVTSDPVAAGFITKAVLGDDMAISQKRQIDKGYSVPQSDLYQTGQVGISSFIAALEKKYADDPQNADYLKQRADLENQSSTLIDKFPEYKTSQLTKAVAIELNKLHPEVANDAAMAQLYLPEIKKEMGLSDEDVKAIDFDNYPTSNFITSTIAPIYKGALGLGAFGTRIIGTALGADSDFLNSRITEMQKSPTFFDDINTMQNTGQTVDTNKTSPTFLQDVADPNKGKYNYNFHTISNAIGNGIGQLAWFVYGTKGAGALANKAVGALGAAIEPEVAGAMSAANKGEMLTYNEINALNRVNQGIDGSVSVNGIPFKLSAEATNEVGMAGLIIGQGYEDNYQKARTVISDKPEDEWKRNAFALLQGSLDYLGFRVLGNVVKGLPPTAEKEIGQVFKDAPNLAAVNKTALQSKLTNILQGLGEAGKETAFVGTATTASEIAKAAVINVLGNDKAAEEENKQLPDVITSSIASLPFSMFLPIVGAKIIAGGQSKIQNENIYNAGLNPESYKGDANKLFDMGAINQQQLNDRIQVINTAHDVVKSIPSDVFDNLNHNQRVSYVNSKIKEVALKAKAANIQDDALSEFYNSQIKNEVAKRADILNGGGKDGEYPQSVAVIKPKTQEELNNQIPDTTIAPNENVPQETTNAKVILPQTIAKEQGRQIVTTSDKGNATENQLPDNQEKAGTSNETVNKVEQPTEENLISQAKDLVNSGVVKGFTADILKESANNNPTEFKQHLKDISEQANDPKSNKATVDTYGQPLVDIATKLFPKEATQAEQQHIVNSNIYDVVKYEPIGGGKLMDFVKIGNKYIDPDVSKHNEALSGLPVSELSNEAVIKQRLDDLYHDKEMESDSGMDISELNNAISFLEKFLPENKPTISKEQDKKGSESEELGVGTKWDSPRGKKEITGSVMVGNEKQFTISIDGKHSNELIKVADLQKDIARDKSDLIHREEARKEGDITRDKEAKKQEFYNNTNGFADGKSPMEKAKILKVLNTEQLYNGELKVRKTFIEDAVANGGTVKEVNGKKRLYYNDNRFIDNLTKTEYDYADYLNQIKNKPKEQTNPVVEYRNKKSILDGQKYEVSNISERGTVTLTPIEGKTKKEVKISKSDFDKASKQGFYSEVKKQPKEAEGVSSNSNEGAGFTPKEVIDEGYKKIKDSIGQKKAQKYFEQVDRLLNPNENNIVEYRENGVVTKEGDKYTFHALSDMDLKNWRLGFKRDISDQFIKQNPASKVEGVSSNSNEANRVDDLKKELNKKIDEIENPKKEIKISSSSKKSITDKLNKVGNPKVGDVLNIDGSKWIVNKTEKRQTFEDGKYSDTDGYRINITSNNKGENRSIYTDTNDFIKHEKSLSDIQKIEQLKDEYDQKISKATNEKPISKPVSEAANKIKNKYKDKVKGLFDTGESKNADMAGDSKRRITMPDGSTETVKTDNGKQSINQYVSRAKEVANKLFPDAKFETFDTHADFEKAGGIEGSRGTAITDSKGNKTILLNLAQMREDGVGKTAFHEVIHPIVSEVFGKTPEELVPVWNDITATMSDIKGMDKVWEHLVFYGENKTPVEGITEFLTQIADGNIKVDDIPKAKQSKFLDLINRLFEKLGINYKFDSGVDLHNFAKEIKKAFDTGDVEGLKKYTDKGSKKLSDNVNADTSSDKEALVTNMVKDAMDEGLTSLNEVRDAITSGLENNSPELKKLIEDAYNKLSSKGEVEGNGGDNVPPEQRGVDNNSDSFSEWSRVNLDSLSKIKDQFRKIGIGWDERAESAMRNLQKRSKRGERLYDTAVREMDNFYKSLSKDKTPRFNTDDQVAMHFLKIATEQSMARLTEDAMSKNAFSNVESIGADILNEQFNRVNAVLGAMRSESGVGLAYGNVEARLSPDYGLKVRQMQMIRANKGEPLSDEQNNFVKDHWEKEKELNKREQQVREQAIKDEFEKRISDLQSDFEKRIKDLKEKKASEPNTKNQKRKLSSTLRDISKRIRETNEFDKFIKGDKGDIKAAGVTFDMKEGLAQAIDYIAKAVEGTEKLSDAIRKAVEKYKGDLDADGIKEFRDKIHGLITKASLPDRELSFDKIKELAIKDQATTITKEMVGKNLIKDFIDSHIGDFDKKDILNEATKRLQEVLPDVTKEQVTEAYLKKGEFLLPQKSRLDEDVAKEKMALKKIAKDELTANQQQKIKLQEEKQRALKRIEELKGLQERGEYTTDQPSKPVILAKQDAELINIDRERNKLESAYRKEADKIKENQNHIVQRVLDTARSLWVAVLIGRPKTFAKIAWFMVARPTSEVLSKLSFGRAFGLIAPDLASAAKVGGESNSTRSIGKMSAAFFRNMGAEKLQRLYENGEKRYAYAKAAYEQYKNTEGHSEKKLAALKRDMDNKMFDSLGNIMYQFIGGSSIKDAIETLVHRTNIIEKQFGKIRDESIKDGNGLDKFNYIMGFIGRSHSALKTLSGRASFAGAFMARIEAAFERGQDLGTNKLLEIAHESYLDWERGKYQQSNWISDTWNRIVTSIDEGKFNKEKWKNYNKSAQLLARTEVAITRVPVNIIHEEVAEYLAGAFRAPILAAKAYNRAKAQAIEEGYTKKIEVNNGIEHGTTKEEFNKRVGEIVRDMDGEQAAKVMRLFRKGGMGLGLYAAALIWGGIHFGIFPHKGQKKVKKEQDLAPDELNPGQIMFGKDKLGDVTSAMISHTPALWDTFMGLGMAKSYYDDVNNGRSTMDAAARDLVLHLKIIESNIPQAQIISPTETVQKVGTGFKKNILDSWGLTDGVDTKGGLPKNSPVSNYLDKEDIEVSVPERYQLNVGKDKLHPFGRMTDEDYSKFKKIRSSLLNERLSQFLPAAQSGGLSRDKIQKEIKSIAASSTTIAKEQMIAQGIISPINSSN